MIIMQDHLVSYILGRVVICHGSQGYIRVKKIVRWGKINKNLRTYFLNDELYYWYLLTWVIVNMTPPSQYSGYHSNCNDNCYDTWQISIGNVRYLALEYTRVMCHKCYLYKFTNIRKSDLRNFNKRKSRNPNELLVDKWLRGLITLGREEMYGTIAFNTK